MIKILQKMGLEEPPQHGKGHNYGEVKSLSHVQLFVTPWTVACNRLLHPLDFLGKSTGVSCHFLLQEIFSTQDQTQVIW